MLHRLISGSSPTFTEHQALPTSNSSQNFGVDQLENQVCVCTDAWTGRPEFQDKTPCIRMLEPLQHGSKNGTCACWSKIKPQNSGLKCFFKIESKSETSIDKSRDVLAEVGMRGGLETQPLALSPSSCGSKPLARLCGIPEAATVPGWENSVKSICRLWVPRTCALTSLWGTSWECRGRMSPLPQASH